MSRFNRIKSLLTEHFNPIILDIQDESHLHNVPQDIESHFKIILVSDLFNELKQVQRHQKVYRLLSDEMNNGLHAVSLKLYNLEEWANNPVNIPSPQCHGGHLK